MNKNIKIILLLTSLFLILTPRVMAQNVDLGIYPPVFEIEANPPTDFKVPFFIQNFTDESIELTAVLKPFRPSTDENGTITLADENVYDFPDPFILQRIRILDETTEVNKFTVSPKQRKDLVLQIQIPPNEPKGEYYIAMLFTNKANPDAINDNSQIAAGIASNILLSVGPLGKTQGSIEEFSSPNFLFKGPVPFTIRTKNTSDHFITVNGNIVIKNMYGQSVGKVDLLPTNVLSNSIRKMTDILQSGTAKDADYIKIKTVVDKSEAPVAIWPEKFLFGPYTATLTLALSNNGPLYVRKISFFAFPAEYLLGILIIIGIVIFIVARVRKKINLK